MVARTFLMLHCALALAVTITVPHVSTAAALSSSGFPLDAPGYSAIFGVTQQDWERVAQKKMREQGYQQREPGHEDEEDNHERAPTPAPEAQWMEQLLDHFDGQNNHTFQQRYFVNDKFFNASRPLVFLSIGGEGAASPNTILYSNIAYQAHFFQAMLVLLEHRFYGASVPNNDESTENLKYLTSEQALADLASLRTHIIAQYPELGDDSQWIVVGGSYPGSLSAWARLKYPHLFLGSISSSAPIQAETDFYQYNEVVARSLGEQCSSQIQLAMEEVATLLNTTSGQAQLVANFSLCSGFTSQNDQTLFLSGLANPIKGTVQYAWDYRPGVWNISSICNIMENDEQSPYENLVDLQIAYRSYFNQSGCISPSYSNYIRWYRSRSSDAKSWLYQTCNEFGWFQTGTAEDQPFSHLITKEFYLQQCQDVFRVVGMQPHVQDTNRWYGGFEIRTSNTVFTNGDVDPVSSLGNPQQYPASGNTQNILIHGTGHCRDLMAPQKWDPPTLVAARMEQLKMMEEWIEEDLMKKQAVASATVAME